MTGSENDEQLQYRVIEYLYGDLAPRARARFEQELEANPALKRVFEQEQRLDSVLPVGMQPRIDQERLQGNRWVLRRRLQKAASQEFSPRAWLDYLRRRPLAVSLQGMAMALAFTLGILVASSRPPDGFPAPGLQSVAASPLELINEGDYEIYQLRVNNYDATTGEIDLSFSLASDTRLTGNVADQTIHRLMATALKDDIDSAARLDTINILQAVNAGDEVFEALIHVLLNDENPGVRYQAVLTLADLAGRERVREGLRAALRQDVNQGVRIEAFNALMDYQDEATLALFRQQMETDSNEYIRAQARSIVEEAGGAGDDAIF